MTIASLNDFKEKLTDLPGANTDAAGAVAKRDATLTKPAGSLGRLEELAVWIAGWQRQHPPCFDTPQVTVFAGNHGVCRRGVSAFPPEVTTQMVANFEAGGAAINQLATQVGARFSVHPLDLDRPTADVTEAAALTENDYLTALNTGWMAVDDASDILVVGEMGIGNTTIAALLCAALFGGKGEDWAGPGTGVSPDGVSHKAVVINQALEKHASILADPVLVLQHLGGRELAAMAGAILAARHKNIPVVLDGFVTCAAAAALHKFNIAALDHCVAGHVSAEPGHVRLLQHLGKEPLLNLKMRLGEGSGAALALNILKAAVVTHTGMASFAEAGVSESE